MGRVRRGVTALTVCLVSSLLAFAVPAAGSSLTKHCAGSVAVTQSGVTLEAGRIRIQAQHYLPQLHLVPPALGCHRARAVLHDFLLAKLTRGGGAPNQCTDNVLRGGGCKVGRWLCYEELFLSRPPNASDLLCTKLLRDRRRAVDGLDHIFFHETDH